ncbi:two-component system response regulator [Streptomyces sp. NPDC056632]|uniref:response regulator n=1 Tax=Streptomyces sp. NPDC056632 TaxID=3345884 RepID=UPI0036A6A4A5
MRPLAWLIEDHPRVREETSSALRSLGLDVCELANQEQFVQTLASSELAEATPRVVVLDLRLPWADTSTLAANAMVGGIGCLELLRQEPLTASVPVIVYSAFVHDPAVYELLAPHQPLTIVDKMEPDRLRVVIENVLPEVRPAFIYGLHRLGKLGERRVLRIGALAAAIAAIITLIALISKWASH